MEKKQLCIYAIKAVKDLNEAYKNGKMGTFLEEKAWREGREHFKDARNEDTYLPIIFADAGSIWELLYWAKLTNVEILPNINKQSKSKSMTRYSFKDMQRYPKRKTPYSMTELIVNSTGKPISEGFIRSYSICVRPQYLK